MASYRYLVADILTNTVQAELPLTAVQWSRSLNEPGQASGSMLLSDPKVRYFGSTGTDPIETATRPAMNALYIERDGTIVWGGIIWSRSYNSDSQTVTIGARTFESFYERRRAYIDNAYDPATTDVLGLVSALLTHCNNSGTDPYYTAGIDLTQIGTAGINIPSVYALASYEGRTYLSHIQDLAAQAAPYGFDFSIEYGYSNTGELSRTFRCWYPKKGSDVSTSSFYPALEFPGSMLGYNFDEDGRGMIEELTAFGPGTTEGQYRVALSSPVGGFPRLDDVVTYQQVLDPGVVDKMAASYLAARNAPVATITAVWSPTGAQPVQPVGDLPTRSIGPDFSEFAVGDQFLIRILDDRFPNGFVTTQRLANFTVSVGDGDGPEIINGTFVDPTY
jgi:hypothetical protein